MKKNLLIIVATAMIVASCANNDTFKEINTPDEAIGFSTITGKLTRAENSTATVKHSLGRYHNSFQVWSSKTVKGATSTVFNGQTVNAALTTSEELYDAAGARAKNAILDGALNSTDALTEQQAGLYNTAIGGAPKVGGSVLSEDEAAAYNATLAGAVKEGDIKTEAVYDWTYSPLVFWDKSATSYTFNAAAPAGIGWTFAEDLISLDDFSVDGATIAESATIDPKAVFGPKDIMISEDIDNYTTYTASPVNLSFIHLLSRLNIGVKKDATTLGGHVVKLKSITVYNLNSNGKFVENKTSVVNTTPGGIARWGEPSAGQNTFTTGKGFSTETVVTTDYNYVYQALAIPQQVDYEAGILLNGSNAAENSKPYLNISYEIRTQAEEAVNYTAQEAIDYNAALPGAVTTTTINPTTNVEFTAEEAAEYNAALNGAVSTATVKIPAVASRKLDDYSYTYNLADMFNGDGNDTNVIFGEGWMNTLKITINPIAIDFDADVYEWAPVDAVEVDVPDVNTPA